MTPIENATLHEIGFITLYVDMGDNNAGSMESQVIAMYVKATSNHLTTANALEYKGMVIEWANQNMDTINAAYKEARELLPGHVYLGVQPKNKKEKLWHLTSGDDVVGKEPAKILHAKDTFTHKRTYKASPETIRKITDFLDRSEKNVSYYHWNADQIKSLNGKHLSNYLVFVIDAIRAAGIDTSRIDHVRDPWYLARELTSRSAN